MPIMKSITSALIIFFLVQICHVSHSKFQLPSKQRSRTADSAHDCCNLVARHWSEVTVPATHASRDTDTDGGRSRFADLFMFCEVEA